MKKIKENFLSVIWAIKLAVRINAGIFYGWGLFSILISVLPAVALSYNRQVISILSVFLSSGKGSFNDVFQSIIILGLVLTAVGLSKRINGDFLYFVMYDAYYFGFEEYMMDAIQQIELKTLMDNHYRDDHSAVIGRGGALTEFISSGFLFLSKLAGAVSLLFIALQISVIIFAITAVYIIAILLLNIFAADKWRWDGRKYNAAMRRADYYQHSSMTPGVAKELRVYKLEHETVSQWEKSYDRAEELRIKYAKVREAVGFISGISFYIFMAGIMAYCIFQIANSGMKVDIFLMLYAMGQSISEIAHALSFSFHEADGALFSLNMQRKFFSTIPKTAVDWAEGFEPEDYDTVFKAESICFSYDDENLILHDLSFSIKKGETIALVGVNGSGKTTLVKLLIGLFSPTKGKLSFYGKTYDERVRGALIHKIGMFFQDYHIFHKTLRENVGFGDIKNICNVEQIKYAMEKGGADKLPSKFPNGLEQWLGRQVKKDGAILSGGEKQRVAVSRAYMSDKEILIFDEPAAALDPIAEMKQFQTIREKIGGRTAILISHRVGFARLADRIFVLDQGRIAECGTHEKLLSKGGKYAEFFREQAQWYDANAAGGVTGGFKNTCKSF